MHSDVIGEYPTGSRPYRTTSEATAAFEYGLCIAEDDAVQALAERMARLELDALDDFDLAAELVAVDHLATTPPEPALPLRCAA